MAKGRKLITSRSELLLGSYGYGGNTIQHDDDDGGEELREDDVWSMVDHGMVNRSDHDWKTGAAMESNMGRGYRSPVPVPRSGGASGGLSSALEDGSGRTVSSPRIVHNFLHGDGFASPRGRHVANSAPVNVPDWSKIYRVDSVESMHDSDDIITDDQDMDMVPPHEYLARAYARGHDSVAHSVFVGSGRTLKGRDLSRVRDAVWSQTGFNG